MLRRSLFLPVALVAALGCGYDWDSFDPRLATATGNDGGAGGTITGGQGGGGGSSSGGMGGGSGATGGQGGAGGQPPLGPWSTPQTVPAFEHVEDDDDPTMTADQLEVVFNSKRSGNPDLWVSIRSSPSEPWPAPSAISDLNSTAVETNVTIAPDGLTIWFDSDRADPTQSGDYYVATRLNRTSAWSTPVLAADLNQLGIGDVGGVTGDGLLMLVHADGGNGYCDLFQLERASPNDPWGSMTALSELNTASRECEPWLDPAGLVTYFRSNRDGNDEHYEAARSAIDAPFAPPAAVSELNDPMRGDSDATLSPDLRYIMFARSIGPNGEREIFHASR